MNTMNVVHEKCWIGVSCPVHCCERGLRLNARFSPGDVLLWTCSGFAVMGAWMLESFRELGWYEAAMAADSRYC